MIEHHPSLELLASYVSGQISVGQALVLACHVHVCATCRAGMRTWESVGGAMLDGLAGCALSDDAFIKTLDRLTRTRIQPKASEPVPRYLERFNLPGPLRGRRVGARRWITPSIWLSPIDMYSEPTERTYLVYARSNAVLPRHTHAAPEVTAVLAGSFTDDTGTYTNGDFAEADHSVEHSMKASVNSECLCLISSGAPMLAMSPLARAVQTLMGRRY